MAVDAHHLLLSNKEVMMNNNTTTEQINGGFFTNNQIGYGVVSPFSVTDDSPPPPLLHMYDGSSTVDTIPTTTYYADGNNVDCDFFPLTSRKRFRDSRSSYYQHHLVHQNLRSSCAPTTTSPFSFLGQDIDISSHINQQQHEIDRCVSLHMERVKFEIQQKRKMEAITMMKAIEQGLKKRLRVKEEERERIGKINHELEEQVKSLSVENQIWQDLAQTNEATVNNLRTNLEQVLAQVNVKVAAEEDDDAKSYCGSSSGDEKTVRRNIAIKAHGRDCRNCGEEESCVLFLPCRHLCLCGICGSTVHTCPICKSPKIASVHVNMSS